MADDPKPTVNLETGKRESSSAPDMVRKWVGYTLLGLLIVIVLLAYVTLFFIQAHAHHFDQSFGQTALSAIHAKTDADQLMAIIKLMAEQSKADADRLSALLNIVFGPVVTLLGSVIGFYFGSKSAGQAAGANNG